MKRLPLFVLFSALFALAFSGCGSSPVPNSIQVSITSCAPAPDEPGSVSLTLRYANESVFAIGLVRSNHRVFFNGTLVAKIEDAPPVGLPAMGAVNQTLVMRVENPAALRQMVASAGDRTVSYRVESVLFQVFNEDDFRVNAKSEGSVDLRPLAE